MLDLVGLAVWIYLLTKLFVFDVDRAAIEAIAPSAVSLVDFRLVAYLAILAVPALFVRHWWRFVTYIALFPLVVVLWKIPRQLFHHRSWPLFLALLQTCAALLADFRYNVITKSLAVVAAILVVFTDQAWLIIPSALYIAFLLCWSFARRLRRLPRKSTFISLQQRAIETVVRSEGLKRFTTIGDQYLAANIEFYDSTQANQVTVVVAIGIGVNKALYLWAYHLDRYRRHYLPAVVFSFLSYSWLAMTALVGLTLLNLSVLKLAPDQFAFTSPRPPIAVLLYTLATFFVSTAGDLRAAGNLGYLLQFVGGLTGEFVLLGLIVTVVLVVVRSRDNLAIQQLITLLKESARQQEAEFLAFYGVPVDEAYRKLEDLGGGAVTLVKYIVRAVPNDLDE